MEFKLRKIILYGSLALLAVFLFWWRFDEAERKLKEAREGLKEGQAEIRGMIANDPEEGKGNIKFTLRAEDGRRYLVFAELGREYKYGDKVFVSGKVSNPENFTTSGGRVFDYVHYLAKDKIYHLVRYPEIEILGEGGNKIKKILFSFKNALLASAERILSPPESTLLGGLLLGEDAKFTQKLNDDFVRTGTIHIVALSGFNVTIVAEAVMRFFNFFLTISSSIALGILSIILFAVMTGAGPTIVRASIMAILALVARATGRTYEASRALFIAGFIMVMLNPMILVYDISFQLSFIATFAIIHLSPKMEKYFRFMPKLFDLRQISATTAAAYVFVLPFLLYKMGVLSVVALPANILILPAIPATMLFGFIAALLGIFASWLALSFSFIAHLLLFYQLGVINWFASLRFASFNIGQFSTLLLILIYAVLLLWIFRKGIYKNSAR